MNHDGRLDVAMTNASSYTVGARLGAGDGSFGPQSNAATGSGPSALAAADVNRDGNVDLITANWGPGGMTAGTTASVLLGNGSGAFGPAVDYTVGRYPLDVKAGDFNGDGAPDLAFTDTTRTVHVRERTSRRRDPIHRAEPAMCRPRWRGEPYPIR